MSPLWLLRQVAAFPGIHTLGLEWWGLVVWAIIYTSVCDPVILSGGKEWSRCLTGTCVFEGKKDKIRVGAGGQADTLRVWRSHTEDRTDWGHGGWPHAGTHCPLRAALRRQPSQLLSLKRWCQVPLCLCAPRQNPGPLCFFLNTRR